jgi:hypothetical protein
VRTVVSVVHLLLSVLCLSPSFPSSILTFSLGGSRKTRNITPKNIVLPIETIKDYISKERNSIAKIINAFLKDPEPSIWIPPEYASNREYLASLRLPTYPNGSPSLLLHNLDACDPVQVERLSEGLYPLCVIITCASNHSHHRLQVHLQHIGIGKNTAHVGSPHEKVGILLCCNSG